MPNYFDEADRPTEVPRAEIAKALAGIDFPADKARLKEQAQRNEAPRMVLEAIEQLPGREFASPADVERAYEAMRERP